MKARTASRWALGVLVMGVCAVAWSGAASAEPPRHFNHDSLVVGGTVHSFAGDVGPISPFLGMGFKWDTFSDFQGIEGLKDRTIWEYIALGLTVYGFVGLTDFEVDEAQALDAGAAFDRGSAFQVGILATMMVLPGWLHPYVGIGFAWTELRDASEALEGSQVFPMLDVNLGARLDLSGTLFVDFSNYANWGRDGAVGVGATQDILFFSTFLGLGVNVL